MHLLIYGLFEKFLINNLSVVLTNLENYKSKKKHEYQMLIKKYVFSFYSIIFPVVFMEFIQKNYYDCILDTCI